MLVPEAHGGLGLGIVDAVVVQEEMGRALFPGPFFSSAIVATLAARALGLDDQLAALAAGTERGTVALDEAGYGDPIERVHVRAAGRGTRYKLDGVKPMVLDGCTADWVLVPARTREGIQTFLVERPCDAQPVASLDVTRKFARFEFDQTRATLVGPPGDHADIWRRVADDAAVLLAAELIGVSEAANAARARLRAGARGVRQAAVEVPGDAAQGRRHAARDRDRARRRPLRGLGVGGRARPTARSRPRRPRRTAAHAANYVTAECIQIHGGVGYTWECDAHLYLRRAKVDDLLMGYQGWQRDRVADLYFASL